MSFKVGARIAFDPNDADESENIVKLMGCEKGVVQELCELYPRTCENMKMRSLEKRAVYLYYMGEPTAAIAVNEKSRRRKDSNDLDSWENIGTLIKNTEESLIQNPKFLENEGHKDDCEDVAVELQEITERTLELMTRLETCARTLMKESTTPKNKFK